MCEGIAWGMRQLPVFSIGENQIANIGVSNQLANQVSLVSRDCRGSVRVLLCLQDCFMICLNRKAFGHVGCRQRRKPQLWSSGKEKTQLVSLLRVTFMGIFLVSTSVYTTHLTEVSCILRRSCSTCELNLHIRT